MSFESSQAPCLICNTIFIKYASSNVNRPPNVVESNKRVFNSCSKYLGIDINTLEDSLSWNFNWEPLPFCEICFLTTNKLHSLNEQIETLEKEVKQIVDELKILLSKSHHQTNQKEGSFNLLEAAVQDKIENYRLLALFGNSSCRRIPFQSQTRSRKEKPDKGPAHNKTDTIDTKLFDCNDSISYYNSGDELIGADGEVDIKYEPASSPDYCTDSGTLENCNFNPSAADLQVNTKTFKASREDGGSRRKGTNNSQNRNKACEKYSDSIAELLNIYKMNVRIPVIKLHRLHEVKNNQSGDTSYLPKNRENNQLMQALDRKRTIRVRVMHTTDGRQICGGILLKSTPDGQQQCGDCDKIYSNATKLVRHIKTFHLGIKQKCYNKPIGNKIILRVTTTPEGKNMYGGVEIASIEHGYFRCTVCERQCPSMDSIMRHIRWYHLGDEATKMYSKRREAYFIKRQKALGKPISKEKIRRAEELLKKKVDLKSVISSVSTAKVEILNVSTRRSELKKETPANKNRTGTSNIPIESDSEESEPDDESHFDNGSNGSDFYSDGCESYKGVDNGESDEDDSRERKQTRNSSRISQRIKVIRQTDGKQFCGGIQFTANEDETEWRCGKKNCSKIFTNKYAVCRHIKALHLGMKQSPKSLNNSEVTGNKKAKKATDSDGVQRRKKADPKIGKNERPHFTSGGLLFNGILSKKTEKGWYQCGFDRSGSKCEKVFPTSFATLAHIKTFHINTKNTSLEKLKCLRVLTTPDGKKSYGDVIINEPDSNTVVCGECQRSWTYKTGYKRYLDGICTHIRNYHLGEKATEMYRQKRRAHQIKKMKRLGRLVRKKDLINAEKILKNKIPITTQIMLNVGADTDPFDKSGSNSENTEKITSELKLKDENNSDDNHSGEENSSDYDFSVDEDEDGNPTNPLGKDKIAELGKSRGRVKLRTKGGKRFCGDVELIEREGERQQCGKCKRVYPNVPSLSRHIKRVHYGFKEKSLYFVPKVENQDFFKVVEDSEGRKTYAGVDVVDTHDGNVACGVCLRCFKLLDLLRRHIRSQHPDRVKAVQQSHSTSTTISSSNTSGVDDSRTYFTKEGLFYNGVLSKKLDKGKYRCGHPREGQPPCRRVCSSSFTIVGHIRREHAPEQPSVKPLRKFNRTITLDDGRKIFLGVEMVQLQDGNLQCGECQKQFTPKQRSGLMGHIMRVHEQKEGGIYICKYCGRNCGSLCWLELHELKHLDEKKYVCDQCGLSYKQAASLTHHKRQVHKGIKRHTCDICGKQYYHTRDFITHQRRHTGEKPFVCCYCGRTFYNIYDMKVHERSHGASRGENPSAESASDSTVKLVEKEEKTESRRSTRKRSAAETLMRSDGGESNDKDRCESWKGPFKKEQYVPNSLKTPNSLVVSAPSRDYNFEMPALEHMSPCTANTADYSANSFQTNRDEVSGPPILVPVYNFMT